MGQPMKRGARAIFSRSFVVFAALLLSACASFYVDTDTKDVAKSEVSIPAKPQPAYLVFEFQTNGAPNPRATSNNEARVLARVKESGLFSEILDKPAVGVAMLSITLNNIPVTRHNEAKGMVTGLTLGAVGTSVTDGYVCTIKYVAPNAKQPVVATATHAIHTTLGATSTPPTGIKATGLQEAVETMVRQIVDNTLKNLSNQPEFLEQ